MYDLFNLMDDVDSIFDVDDLGMKQIDNPFHYSVPSFPPVKISQNTKTGDLTMKFYLAGYQKDRLNISYDKNFLVLSSTSKEEDEDKNEKILANTCKEIDFSYKYLVPESKFDRDSTEAKFNDGVLTIFVKTKKEEDKKIENKSIAIN